MTSRGWILSGALLVAACDGKRPPANANADAKAPAPSAAAVATQDTRESADASACTCPDLVWRNGPALGAWRQVTVTRACTLRDVHHLAPGETTCTAKLSCDDLRHLTSLLARPEVKEAFARDADFGARKAMAVDHTAILLELGGHTLGVAGTCREAWRCPDVPAPVLELLTVFDASGWLPDGGLWNRAPVCREP